MKPSLQQVQLPTSNTTFNVTDPLISNDWKGALMWGGAPTANATITAGMGFWIGACDSAGGNVNFVQNAQDAVTAGPGDTSQWSGCSATTAIRLLSNTLGAVSLSGGYNATLPNGVQLALASNDGIAHVANVLMFAGSDWEFRVSSTTISGSNTSAIVTHNLTGVPTGVMVVWAGNNSVLDAVGHHNFSMAFFDGANSVGMGSGIGYETTPTKVAARVGTADMGHEITGGTSDNTTYTISSVGPSTLTLARGSQTGVATTAIIIAFRNLTSTAAAAAVVGTTPTTTGTHAVNIGMPVAPQVWLNLTSRATVTTLVTNDSAGAWGFSAAVNNNGTTQYGANVGTFESAVTTTVAKTQSSNAQASMALGDTGAAIFTSSVQSWNADGVSENVSTAGSAYERISLVFGVQPTSQASTAAPGPGISPVAQAQFQSFPFSNANALQPYFPPPTSNAPLLSLLWGPGNSPNPQTQFERFPFSTLPPVVNIQINGLLVSNSTAFGPLGLAALQVGQPLGQPSPGVQPYADSQFRMFPFSNSAANTTAFLQAILQSNSLFYGTLVGAGSLGAIAPPNSTFFGFLTPITLGQITGLWQSNSTVYANLTGIGNIAGLSLSNSLLSALKIGSGFQPLVPNTPVLDVRTDTGYEPWSVRPGKTIG